MQLIPPVRRFLSNRHILVPEDWLAACIEWVLSEYSQQSVVFIQEKVYEEWLTADLSELAGSCLPSQIKDELSTTVTGYFALQVNSVRDVSEPAYAQLLKVEGVNTENTSVSATQEHKPSWERKADRMLMLELTDGTVTVEGMEYRPVPCLSADLIPGTKVMLSGSIKARRGILFLTQRNVQVLGGEVQALIQPKSKRNTLVAALETAQNEMQQNLEAADNDRINRYDNEVVHAGPRAGEQEGRGRGGGADVGFKNGNSGQPEMPSLEDEEVDFFDGDLDDMALENEFDEDLDAFMSQM